MSKRYFALKLLPCRPDFAQTMTDQERAVMQEHVVYWKGHMDKGSVIVYGPVLDPAAVYGLAVIGVDNEEQVKDLIEHDPASKINTYEYHPMMAVVPAK